MPLVTQIKRNGKSLKLNWSDFHLNCMFTAALKEASPDMKFEDGTTVGDLKEGVFLDFVWRNPVYCLDSDLMPLLKGEQTLQRKHVFPYTIDGEEKTFELFPGDVLSAWRESKR